jgi:CheY-like chemotaxis protein
MRGFRDSAEPALGEGAVVAGTYHVRREIARSDTGIVYEAHDTLLDRLVALKLAWRDPGMPSLVSEARRCAAVRDPCSVQLHGMGMHEGVEYAIAERIVGKLLGDDLERSLPPELYLSRLRTLVAAVARAHDAGINVGYLSGTTVLLMPGERLVLGRLSLSQVPSLVAHGNRFAPEEDLYSLGRIAIELALGSLVEPLPRLSDLRTDLPGELSDLVDWMVMPAAAARPASARDVLLQLDTVLERSTPAARSVRVLVVEDDASRARWLWGLARRATASAVIETAAEGPDAAHKLNRDQPDLVFVGASLRGVMNALELCMYARGLAGERTVGQMYVIGDVSERDQALFADVGVQVLADDAQLPTAILERIRAVANARPRNRSPRTTISG